MKQSIEEMYLHRLNSGFIL